MNVEWCKQNCPYQPDCGGGMCNYIIDLVGDIQPKAVVLEERKVGPIYEEAKLYHCPKCNKILSRARRDFDTKFCYSCGQAVTWESMEK